MKGPLCAISDYVKFAVTQLFTASFSSVILITSDGNVTQQRYRCRNKRR